MLDYLWNFDLYRDVNWGIKNLEFMLMLVNDLNDDKALEILL